MLKSDVLKRIKDGGVIAVVRTETSEQAFEISKACIKGGLSIIEITFTVPGAEKVINDLSNAFSIEELMVGAGTVLDSKTAEIAILAGAKYIVSPGFDLETAKLCHKHQIPYVPGCATVTEMMVATKAGCDVIKLFPGFSFGPAYVKAIRSALPNINIMPTGGISLDSVAEWVNAGVVAIGVGSELTKPAKHHDYEMVTDLAKQFVETFKQARK